MTIQAFEGAPEPRTPRKFIVTTEDDDNPGPSTERIRSDYVETHWLPYLGPMAILLARKIDLLLSTDHKATADVDRWAGQMGVTAEEVLAGCHRLVRYGLARWGDREPMLIVTRHWPHVPVAIQTPLHRRVLINLPDVETTL
jgi:hypothetical protein